MDLVTTHINADLDAMASMVAVHCLFGAVQLALPAGMDAQTHQFWQEQAHALPPLVPSKTVHRYLTEEPLGTLYVVDTASRARLGFFAECIDRFAVVKAWDTHTPHAADDLPRLAIPQVAACVSALVLLMREQGVTPSPAQAGLFLLGIHQETGHFTYTTTTQNDHLAASACYAWSAPLEWLNRYLPRGFTRQQLGLLETMAQNVEVVTEAGHTAALIAIETPEFQPDLAVLLEQLREAEQWPTAVLVAGCGDRATCIVRSQTGMDASRIARALGGGGHAQASSAVLREVTLTDARRLVRSTLLDFMGQQLTAGKVASRPVISVPAAATIRSVAEELYRRRFNAIPITKGRGATKRFVGLVTRQEIDAALRHGLGKQPVININSESPTWVEPQTPLHTIRRDLLTGRRRLVLVGQPPQQPVGVLTRGLVLRSGESLAQAVGARRAPPAAPTVMAMVKKQVSPATWTTLETLAAVADAQHRAIYLVGGTVRDLLLQVPVRDLDLLVEGSAIDLARAAAKKLGGKLVCKRGFATARWYPPAGTNQLHAIDFASARSEYYAAPGALPQVAHASVDQDLYRRDFTINAMAIMLNQGEAGRVVDPYGGLADLHDGILRVLHGLSFHDDPTRAWRAARFAARFDFHLAADTLGLIKSALRSGVMELVSQARIGNELQLIFNEREVVQAFRLLRQWGLLALIHPRLHTGRALLDRLAETRAAHLRLQGLNNEAPTQADVMWIALASFLPADDRAARLAFISGRKPRQRLWLEGPERIGRCLKRLRSARHAAAAGRCLAGLELAELIFAFALAAAPRSREWIVWWLQQGRTLRSAVTGDQLLALGFPAGPAIKAGLEAALDGARRGATPPAQLAAAQRAVRKTVGQGRGKSEGTPT